MPSGIGFVLPSHVTTIFDKKEEPGAGLL